MVGGKGYLAYIDGLRAVAVTAVVIFHAWPEWMSGGFVGVDIFFVISGYLITGIILKDIEVGRFNYLEFFGRRLRRIGPALAVVLLFSTLIGFFILPYGDFRLLGLQTTASAAFSANILFWFQSGYFDALSNGKILLHLWSLGVEEQFYIVWPGLLVAAAAWRTRWRASVLVVIGVSFAINVVLAGQAREAAFYLLPSRLWELGLGGLLARRHLSAAPLRADVGTNIKTALGAALMIGSTLFLTQELAFPGWWAILPTAGAMLIIDAGPTPIVNRLLGSEPFRQIGVISYPLYLWHWPILVFERYTGRVDAMAKVGAIALTLVLAFLTYELVERPIRFGVLSIDRRLRLRTINGILFALISASAIGHFAPMVQVATFGLPVWARSGVFSNYSSYDYGKLYRNRSCFLGLSQTGADFARECFGDHPERQDLPLVLLWGDSHAAHLYPGLLAQQRRLKNFRLAQLTGSLCAPIFGLEMVDRPHCGSMVDAAERAIPRMRPDIVIMAANWTVYARPRANIDAVTGVELSIDRLHAMGIHFVVVIGPVPSWDAPLPEVILAEMRASGRIGAAPKRVVEHQVRGPQTLDPELRKVTESNGAKYISALDTLCNERGCLVSVGHEDNPVSYAWDHDHFTEEGSVDFVQRIWPQIENEISVKKTHSAGVAHVSTARE